MARRTRRSDLPGPAETRRQPLRARYDPLTALPNRWHATSLIQAWIASRTARRGRTAALIVLDLDGFRAVNEMLGHEAGDLVLDEIATRLRDQVSAGDIAGRLGDDEFVLFLNQPATDAGATALTRTLSMALGQPIAVSDTQFRLGVSMGVARYPRDGIDAAILLRHADLALRRAKTRGCGGARFFEPEMLAALEESRMLESDLRQALANGTLDIRFQPQFSCGTLAVTGFETLTRWVHPTRGDVPPAAFIPVAERSGLIAPLGLWVLEKACEAAARWTTRQRVAVNLSPVQLRGETIVEDIHAILVRTQFPAHLLELEVTENALLDDDQRALDRLRRLRAMDVRITLDDFGTGYASLSYLRRFPFDKVKIDKSFIRDQRTDRQARVMLEAMIRLCGELGLDVVVEGVETEQHLSDLRALGCREVQGFLLAEPLLADEVEPFLARHGRRAGSSIPAGPRLTPTFKTVC